MHCKALHGACYISNNHIYLHQHLLIIRKGLSKIIRAEFSANHCEKVLLKNSYENKRN